MIFHSSISTPYQKENSPIEAYAYIFRKEKEEEEILTRQ